MNRWYQIRRMRGAAWLILIGVLALLNQWRILSWNKSWPFFLIVAGLLALAERAAWTADVREQQAAQNFVAVGQPGQPMPPNPVTSGSWTTPAADVGEQPFIQTHPPAPEDPGREER
jgi:hypothetical protein